MRLLPVILLLAACEEEDKVYYEQFNCPEDYTFIGVGADEVSDHGQEDDTNECGDSFQGLDKIPPALNMVSVDIYDVANGTNEAVLAEKV